MKKGALAAACAAFLVLSGCALAEQGTAQGECFVGCLVTRDRLPAGDADGRLYAETVEGADGEPELVFPVEGAACFVGRFKNGDEPPDYTICYGNQGILSDAQMEIVSADAENKYALSATIHVLAEEGDMRFHMNPIYQDGEGRFYASANAGVISPFFQEGQGIGWDMEGSCTLPDPEGKGKRFTVFVDLQISCIFPTEQVVVLQLDENSELLSRTAYTPEEMPERIAPEAETVYIVMETHKTDLEGRPTVTRALYDASSEYLPTYTLRQDGYFTERQTTLDWS